MGDKGWRHKWWIHRHHDTFRFGAHLEAYRWTPGWPSITLLLWFWHRTYKLWLYKMGED